MNKPGFPQDTVLEPEVQVSFKFGEFVEILRLRPEHVCEWVEEGLLTPTGRTLDEWRFGLDELARARRAARLQREFHLDASAVPLVMILFDEIERLRRQLELMRQSWPE
ncbi:MAG: hypothetical protein Kow0020_12680 [Wenzhouxiangellaceae bacterium]